MHPTQNKIYQSLKSHQLCYFDRHINVAPIIQHLKDDGFTCINIDLTQISIEVSMEKWHLEIIQKAWGQLEISEEFHKWWEDVDFLGVTDRWAEFIGEIVPNSTKSPITIFISNIAIANQLPFSIDTFLRCIRSFSEKKASNPNFSITFCLIGDHPNNLLQDKQKTPFNVGVHIR